jgi:hypothetical protein
MQAAADHVVVVNDEHPDWPLARVVGLGPAHVRPSDRGEPGRAAVDTGTSAWMVVPQAGVLRAAASTKPA